MIYSILYAITYVLGAVLTAPMMLFMSAVVIIFNILGIPLSILP